MAEDPCGTFPGQRAVLGRAWEQMQGSLECSWAAPWTLSSCVHVGRAPQCRCHGEWRAYVPRGEGGVSMAARAVCSGRSEATSAGPELEGAGLGGSSGAEGNALQQRLEEV